MGPCRVRGKGPQYDTIGGAEGFLRNEVDQRQESEGENRFDVAVRDPFVRGIEDVVDDGWKHAVWETWVHDCCQQRTPQQIPYTFIRLHLEIPVNNKGIEEL